MTPTGPCSCGSTAAASCRTRARDYDGSKLAAAGTVVVTINYRLGALGFLAHPALASRPDGPAGNYGMMDQQAALRWVRHNIGQFGGDRHNVTIAGESAGGVAVLFHLVSHGSRGLFDRAIVESGAFALNQQSLGDAEAAGQAFAAKAGCPDQTAACLRGLPVTDLVKNFPSTAIPGVVDGKVITEPLDTSLAAGRFARVPIINGVNHDEELLFVAGLNQAVVGGTFVSAPAPGPATSTPNTQARSQRCSAWPRAGRRRSPPSTRSPPIRRQSSPSVRWSPTRTSRARHCRWTAGRPGACRPSPTSSTTTAPRPAALRHTAPSSITSST